MPTGTRLHIHKWNEVSQHTNLCMRLAMHGLCQSQSSQYSIPEQYYCPSVYGIGKGQGQRLGYSARFKTCSLNILHR